MARSLTFQLATLSVGRALGFVLTFVVPLILVRVFSPEDFGLYKQLFLIHSTVVSILTLGLSASLFYFIPRYPDECQAYISQTLLILLLTGLLGALSLVILRKPLGDFLNNPQLSPNIPYLAAFITLYLVTELLESIMVAFKRAELAAITFFFSELVRGSLMIAAAVFTHSIMVLIIACVAWCAFRVVALIAYLKSLSFRWALKPESVRLAHQFRYATPFGIALLIRSITEALPQYAVSYLYDPLLFAVYSVGYLQIPAVSIAASSVAEVTLVRLTELRNSGIVEESLSVLAGSVTKLSLLLFPLYGWLLLNSHDLVVLLFTKRFESSIPLFQVFLITIPITVLGLDYVPRAFADTRFIFRVNAARFIALAALLAVLMPPFGLFGAAVATVLAVAVSKVIILIKVKNLFRTSFRNLLPWTVLSKVAAATVASTICASVIGATVMLPVVAKLAVSGALFTGSYVGLIWMTDILAKGEKEKILALLQNITRFDKVAQRLMCGRLFG